MPKIMILGLLIAGTILCIIIFPIVLWLFLRQRKINGANQASFELQKRDGMGGMYRPFVIYIYIFVMFLCVLAFAFCIAMIAVGVK